MTIVTTDFDTPVGAIRIAARRPRPGAPEAVVACGFVDHWDGITSRVRQRFGDEEWVPGHSDAADAMARYLAGDIGAIDALEVDAGGSAFQARVWDELRRIPAGTTCSYADIARALGQPTATRAVGTANGRNPVSVVVPCHRVVRADGALGGYGGGLDRKTWLLAHEGAQLATTPA
jgi:methylated-DNA-[protein]-cysteine S-methyltransferase